MKKIQSAIFSIALLSTGACLAARDFTPQPGTWVFRSELNGLPGRGLSIDVQGNTFFMQLFGYEKNGDATFYTASGDISSSQVIAPLMQWRGGKYFGGSNRDAIFDKNLGDVSIEFNNGVQAVIELPGENKKIIERFILDDFSNENTSQGYLQGPEAIWAELDSENNPIKIWKAEFSKSTSGENSMLVLSSAQEFESSEVLVYSCKPALISKNNYYQCSGASWPWPEITPPQGSYKTPNNNPRFYIAANQITGWMDNSDSILTRPFAGSRTKKNGVIGGGTGCISADISYVSLDPTYCQITKWMPPNGTWVVSSELNGNPGRGIGLDIQGDYAILQIFDYLENGQPSFHMGSSKYKGSAEIPIDMYSHGTAVGGDVKPAVLAERTGNASLNFEMKNNKLFIKGLYGSIKLPHEDYLKIQRLELESQNDDGLLGGWIMNFSPNSKKEEWAYIILDKMHENKFSSTDGSVICEKNPDLKYTCQKTEKTTSGGLVQKETWFYSPHLTNSVNAIKIKDSYGNHLGIGHENLP